MIIIIIFLHHNILDQILFSTFPKALALAIAHCPKLNNISIGTVDCIGCSVGSAADIADTDRKAIASIKSLQSLCTIKG